MRYLTIPFATSLLAGAALAHGGQYRGPGDVKPPANCNGGGGGGSGGSHSGGSSSSSTALALFTSIRYETES